MAIMPFVLVVTALTASPSASSPLQVPAHSDARSRGDDNVITVLGQRMERDRRNTVREFVAALAPFRTARPPTRYEREICPLVLGLPQHQAESVATRIRQVAASVQMRVGGQGCERNLFVLVTADKHKLLDELRRTANVAFDTLTRDRVRALYKQPGASVVWHTTGRPVARDGKEALYDDNRNLYYSVTTEAASRMNSGGAQQFASATVVIEREALDGLTVTQLADYAAVRAFTAADPARLGDSQVPTILRVLDAPPEAEVPASLTQWDLAFLRGFARSERGDSAAAVRSSIARDMEKDLARPR